MVEDKKKPTFAKTCEVVQYLEFTPNIKTVRDVESACKSLTSIKTYACIIHDKDDGKKPHFHAVLTFFKAKTFDSVAKAFGIPSNMVNKIKGTTADAEKYLIHANAPDKFQYPADDVVANFDYVDKIRRLETPFDIDAVIEGIDKGTIRQYNIHEHVPILEFSKPNVKSRINNAFEFRNRKMNGVNRNMKVYFVTGPSGVGKTTFAKYFSKTTLNCDSPYVTSGGAHPFDDYGGQSVIICDDFDKDNKNISVADFLKLTDNHTNSLVGCRFYNKSIAECKALIFTSVTSLYRWFPDISDSDRIQVFRRVSSWLQFKDDRLYEYLFDAEKLNWICQGSMSNPVGFIVNKEKRVSVLSSLAQVFAEQFGMDDATKEKFTETFANISAEEFEKEINDRV